MYRRESRVKYGVTVLWIVAVLVFKASPYVTGLLTRQNTLYTTGVVAGVDIGVYQDSLCTQNLTGINWGVCYPGETKTVVAYVKNVGTVNATLTITATDWTPALVSTYLSFQTDYGGQLLQPDNMHPLTFTLVIASAAVAFETFDFNIEIDSQG